METFFTRKLNAGLIGQRLIEAGYLTNEQVHQAVELQKETALLFGEICLLNGWIRYEQLHECLPPMRNKLGNKLMRCGLITMDQLWFSLLEQRQTGSRLGDILIARGWIDIETLEFVQRTNTCPAKRELAGVR